jgi:hypothetical protein
MGMTRLYFAYDANIDPGRLGEIAPAASFEFIAHLPEWKLEYTIKNGKGGLPSVRPLPGNTVWGAVFRVPGDQLAAIDDWEAGEGRIPAPTQAMDRGGRRHDVITHVSKNGHKGEYRPEREHVRLMVTGGRHWNLPTGWVAALEEHLEGD